MGLLASSISNQITEKTVRARAILTQSTMDSTWISALQYYSASMSCMFVLYGGMLGVRSLIEERKPTPCNGFLCQRPPKPTSFWKDFVDFHHLPHPDPHLDRVHVGVYRVNWGESLGSSGIAASLSFAATGFAVLLGPLPRPNVWQTPWEHRRQIMAFWADVSCPSICSPPRSSL